MGVSDQKDIEKRMQRIETLVEEIDAFPDEAAKAKAKELIQSLMDLHGAGLERIMEIIWEHGEPGHTIINAFTRDELVNSLLMLYGLHPLDLHTRVLQALDSVRPYLNSHKGNVELVDVAEREGIVRLRLQGSCESCPSSVVTLKLTVEEAIYKACPEVTAIETEGLTEKPSPVSFVKMRKKGAEAPLAGESSGGWHEVEGIEHLHQGDIHTREVGGRSVLFCRMGESFYAYGNSCPGCGRSLGDAHVEATSLMCAGCRQHYDIIRAGRGLDEPGLYLEPLPLLVEEGRVKVAIVAVQ